MMKYSTRINRTRWIKCEEEKKRKKQQKSLRTCRPLRSDKRKKEKDHKIGMKRMGTRCGKIAAWQPFSALPNEEFASWSITNCESRRVSGATTETNELEITQSIGLCSKALHKKLFLLVFMVKFPLIGKTTFDLLNCFWEILTI